MKKKIFLFTIIFGYFAYSQEHAWVYFSNKENVSNYISNPLTMLSERAIDRRTRQHIALDYKDVPISNSYINQIESANGILVRAKSKWLNAVHVYGSESDITALNTIDFVSSIEFADKSLNTTLKSSNITNTNNQFDELITYNYGNSYNQAHQIHVDFLHEQNFTGSTMQIAVIDAGFPDVDNFSAFQRIRDNNQILGGYDFVNRSDNFYQGSRHGTSVLSTIAGFIDGELVGTAPDAQFYLFITEDTSQETPLEESLWVEAAEKADSLGVNVINTSLGYQDFTEPRYNHTYEEMDGNTTFNARGANIAAEKGMIIVVAAGNDGNNTNYNNIATPADATNTFAVGAVDENREIASFSSYGPNANNQIKPDVCAKGAFATAIDGDGNIITGNGTSYASPIMAGAVACFWEVYPNKTNFEIMQMIRESSHLYNNPTNHEGYGIPNLETAFYSAELNDYSLQKVSVYPNPTNNRFQINCKNNTKIELFNFLGTQLLIKEVSFGDEIDLSPFNSGIYLLQIHDKKYSKTIKIIKK